MISVYALKLQYSHYQICSLEKLTSHMSNIFRSSFVVSYNVKIKRLIIYVCQWFIIFGMWATAHMAWLISNADHTCLFALHRTFGWIFCAHNLPLLIIDFMHINPFTKTNCLDNLLCLQRYSELVWSSIWLWCAKCNP